ncbi:CRISPR-associated protein [Nocardiopsis sp. CNR-923]|uniref:RAMP superfamily CRISPR-associated protein n=1 Tax=Nocardiopsis sp. CNR-923 TaxID=1904965 RepID=UPI000968EC1B|nr:RAMP superfamily CRISPR-associated protein [Nocardiopsis sp. CNR-923]OLT30337.1 CRISPR-associated protein [Nocardiopsis sp. CNR-923]
MTPALVWEVTAHLCLLSDTHVGAAQAGARHAAESDLDLHVDRDPRTGAPRLRATTLAGLLRHELAERTGDPDRVGTLLGSAEPRTETGQRVLPPRPSALDLDDAQAVLPGGTTVAVRAGTRVDPATGAVRPGRTWQWEILPAGTVLTAHLRLRVPTPADESGLLELLVLAAGGLDGLGAGAHVGGRTGRGYGAVRVTRWTARRYDLTDEHGWFAHHARTWAERWSRDAAVPGPPPVEESGAGVPGTGRADLLTALRGELAARGRSPAVAGPAVLAPAADRRRRAELHLALAVGERTPPPVGDGSVDDVGERRDGVGPLPDPRPGLLMIGDAPTGDRISSVDRAHRRRPVGAAADPTDVRLAPVLGDTALFSLFKRVAARLVRDTAEHLGGPSSLWRHWHAHWWGADAERGVPRPSRVRLRATPVLTGGAPLTTTRLTVDALFGDAVDGRLFTTDLHCGGAAEAVLDVREPDEAVLGLLTLLVRELATVPFETLGAGTGSGNGRVTATGAAVTIHPGDGGPARTVDLTAAVFAPASPEAATARRWLAALHARLAPADPSGGDR